MNITELVGEATSYEKKREVERRKVRTWLKSVSAFANTSGGTLIFGIDDDDQVVGLKNIKSDSEFISQKIKERISPFPEAEMKLHKAADGKELLSLYIPRGGEPPYYYIGDGAVNAYVRIGNESVCADAAELKRLIMRGRNSSYDSLISPYDYEDFSFSKLKERYKIWTGSGLPEKSFESFGIRDAKGRLTNAGALLADEAPVYWSRLFCTRWNGLDKSGGQFDALDSAEYSGSLLILLNEGMSFVKRNMKTLWKKTASSRIEMPDYSERSVFEALVNALIHRDYLVNGSEVHIDIFDDHLVIYSPGGMADGTQVQDRDLKNIPSTRRNPILADIFARLGYMERQGSGLSKISSAYENAANYAAGKDPSFNSNRTEFTVTLPNLNFKASPGGALNEALNEAFSEALTDTQKLLLNILSGNPAATQKELALKASISRSAVQRNLKKLFDTGWLERIGSKAKGEWIVKASYKASYKASPDDTLNEALNEAFSEALTDTQKLLLNILRGNSAATQKELALKASISRSAVQRNLKKLFDTGRLERVGSKKTGGWLVKD